VRAAGLSFGLIALFMVTVLSALPAAHAEAPPVFVNSGTDTATSNYGCGTVSVYWEVYWYPSLAEYIYYWGASANWNVNCFGYYGLSSAPQFTTASGGSGTFNGWGICMGPVTSTATYSFLWIVSIQDSASVFPCIGP